MDRLLALANGALLFEALRSHGAGVSYRNVARWVGKERKRPPADMEPLILKAFGVADTENEPPEPPWVGRLEAKVVDELEQMRGVLAGHDQVLIDAVDRAVRRLAAGAGSTQSDDGVV